MGPKSLKTADLVESLPEDPDVGTSLVCSENSRKGEGTRVKRGGEGMTGQTVFPGRKV